MEILFKICLYISNYIPLFILIFIKQLENGFPDTDIKNLFLAHWIIWCVLISVSMLSFLLLLFWLRPKNLSEEIPYNLETKNLDILNYFVTYLIPLLSLDVTNFYSILLNSILFIIIGVYHIKSDILEMNLVLILLGYNVFTGNKGKIFITKLSIEDIYNIESQTFQIGSTKYFLCLAKK